MTARHEPVHRVALHGGYFANNFGDLLLLALFDRALRRAGDCAVAFPCVPEGERARFAGHFPEARTGRDALRDATAVVFAGGGHFGEPDAHTRREQHWDRAFFRRHLLPAEAALWRRVPLLVLGVGVGPLSNPLVRLEAGRVLSRARVLTVRDEPSRAYAQRTLGVRRRVRVAPDPALALRSDDVPSRARARVAEALRPAGERPLLGIHPPRPFLRAPTGPKLLPALVEALRGRNDLLPVVFSDSGRNRLAPDCEQLAARVREATGGNCLVLPFPGVWETVALVGACHAVVTTKLHVGIVAHALGRPVACAAAHAKTPRFWEQVGHPDRCLLLPEASGAPLAKHLAEAADAAEARARVRPDPERVEAARLHEDAMLRALGLSGPA